MAAEMDVFAESELDTVDRKTVTVGGRDIVVIKYKGQYYSLDQKCYHQGGPLYLGDIEEIGDRTCIVCPSHKHKLCVDNGESIVKIVKSDETGENLSYRSRGIKQRVHGVRAENGRVLVTLSDLAVEYPSDEQNF